MSVILGVDISHFQANVNFPALKSSGRDFVVLKATEGVGYADPSFAGYRKAAHAAGLIVGIYHFGRDNSPAAEVAYFAGVVGALQPGEFLVLDQEVTHASGNMPWCSAWLDATRARYGIAPLIYMNQGTVTGVTSGNWTQVAQTYGLWLAKYDNAPTVQSAVPYWGVPAMKQFYDKAQVPGVPTSPPCDVDSFFGTTAQLLAYATPTTTGDDMTPDQWNFIQQALTVTNNGVGNLLNAVGDPKVGLQKLTGDLHGKVVDSVFGLEGRPGPDADDLLGHVLSTRAAVNSLQTAQAPSMDPVAFATALAGNAEAMQVFAAALAPVLAKALGTNLANG